MAEIIRMPKMSDTMEEGVIAAWQVKVGDKIKSGDIIAEVETDKATMELESYEDGTLLYIGAQEKEAIPVNSVIAIIGEEGEDIGQLLKDIKQEKEGGKEKIKENASIETSPLKQQAPAEAETIDTSDIKASLILMPRMSDTMTEGTIAAWHKKVGQTVKAGDVLAEVETDKATMELEAYEDGTLLYIGIKEGESVPVDGIIAVIGEKGADFEKLIASYQAKPASEKEMARQTPPEATKVDSKAVTELAKPVSHAPVKEAEPAGRIKVSPLAKKIAAEKGFNLAKIKGTGDNGRIVKKDVESYIPEPEVPEATAEKEKAFKLPEVVGEESFEEANVSQMRKTIARRLSESKFTSPHFYLTMEINMDRAIEARKSINEYSPVKISFNDLIIKACAASLRQHPKVNSSWRGDKIRMNHHIHIGVAVAVDEGLLVPVIRFADNKSLSHIAAEVQELAKKAKNRQLQPKDWEGNTFSVSNLGMFGIDEFTAIINPPDACILAIGAIKQVPVVKDGLVAPGNVMKVTLSCDHRAVDGATGAAFLQTLKGLLEDPVRILI